MMIRPLLATLATALLLGTATAAPVLKSDVVITSPVVTAGDMFEGAGMLAETGLFRAPLPGTSGQVSLADIKAAATRIGLDEFDAGSINAVTVTRPASIVDEAVLTDLIGQGIAQRGLLSQGMSVRATFATPIAAINADAVDQPATLTAFGYKAETGDFTARFSIAGHAEALELSGRVELMVEAPYLAADLPAGAVLSPEDIVMRPVSQKFAGTTGFAGLGDLVGKQLRRQSRAGLLVAADDVTETELIGRNDVVTIYYRQGPMTLTVKGQALGSAAEGGSVQVLNLMSKRVLSAKAIAMGAVEVSNDPLTLAGL